MKFDTVARSKILRNVRKLVLAKHFNIAGVDHAAWASRMQDREGELVRGDTDRFEAGVREVLAELRSSHTAFYHELPSRFPAPHTINATLSPVAVEGAERWMFVDVYEDGPAHVAGIRPGDLLFAVDGVGCDPPVLAEFGIGRSHLLTIATGPKLETRDISVDVPLRKASKQRPPLVEPKPISYRMMDRDIGYLKVLYFPGAAGLRFAGILDDAMTALTAAGCRRLILDLRGNIGGSLGFARLASYLCPTTEAIGHSLTPERLRDGYEPSSLPRVMMPRTRLELILTLARFATRDKSVMLLTQALGPQPFHRRTVVLVNEWTNSAGEMVAAFAAENQLATLVGQTTRGNVLGAANFNVSGGYWLRLPVFGWCTATGQSLECSGTVPEIQQPLSREALTSGRDEQIHRASLIVAH